MTGEPTDLIDVRESGIEGLGLFARRPIRAGEPISQLHYEREITSDHPLQPEAGERPEHCAYPDGKVLLVAYPDRHMNHSCDPNAYYDHSDETNTITRARRDIEAAEEITVDYLINNPGGDSWPCQCGSARCRGETGISFFHLPIGIQQEYLSLLAPWFKSRYADRLADSST